MSAPDGFGAEWSAARRLGPETELEAWLAFAIACCDAADEVALSQFRRDMAVAEKPDRSLVTEADQGIERLIRERIAAAFPDHGLVGEEYGEEAGAAAIRWFIDPIDATHNFVRGVPLFGTLLAVERDGELQAGVMSAPALGERWYARRGGGAWAVRQGRSRGDGRPLRIRTSAVGSVADAHILYGSRRDIAESSLAPGFETLVGAAWRDRGFGDFWGYALLAEGAAEAMIEADLNSWDMAAPALVVEEAGGRFTSLAGERTIHGGSALATNGHLHDIILEELREGGPSD